MEKGEECVAKRKRASQVWNRCKIQNNLYGMLRYRTVPIMNKISSNVKYSEGRNTKKKKKACL